MRTSARVPALLALLGACGPPPAHVSPWGVVTMACDLPQLWHKVNDDDDDATGISDVADAPPGPGDGDLMELLFEVPDARWVVLDDPTVHGRGRIRLWEDRDRTRPALFGPAYPVPATFYLEGAEVSQSRGDIQFVYRYFRLPPSSPADPALCGPELPVTVYGIASLRWERPRGVGIPLDGNPGPGGGTRIFPDATVARGALHDTVDLRVKLAPDGLSGVRVGIGVYDVDDPSSSSYPLDFEVNSLDNRQQLDEEQRFGGSRTRIVTTDSTGQALVRGLELSTRSGDNYRAVATCGSIDRMIRSIVQDDADKARLLTRTGAKVPDAIVPVHSPRAHQSVTSDLLTVWRRLHVERGSMMNPTGTQNTTPITIASVTPITGPPPPGVRPVLLVPPIGPIWKIVTPDRLDQVDRFEGGTLATTGGTWHVWTNQANWFADNEVVVSGAATPLTGAATLRDDDSYTFPPAGEDLDISVAVRAFRDAYVDVVALPAPPAGMPRAGFLENLTRDQACQLPAAVLTTRSSRGYWVSRVLAVWQVLDTMDLDPDGYPLRNGLPQEDAMAGAVCDNFRYARTAVIAMQVIADQAGSAGEATVVAHEMAHQLGAGHSSGYLTDEWGVVTTHRFSDADLEVIRRKGLHR